MVISYYHYMYVLIHTYLGPDHLLSLWIVYNEHCRKNRKSSIDVNGPRIIFGMGLDLFHFVDNVPYRSIKTADDQALM